MGSISKKSPHAFKIKLIKTFIARPLSLLPLKNIMVFESHSDFCDNSKALFNKILEYGINEHFKIYWLVENIDAFKDKNIKNVKFISIKRDTIFEKVISELRNAVLFSRCKYYFFSHRNFARIKPKKGQIFLNLTHGTSLKDSTGKHGAVLRSSYVLSTSEFLSKIRVKTYRGGESKIRILGFPRNDFLFEEKNSISKLGLNIDMYKKIVIWMPTFRRQKNSDRNDSGTNKRSDIPIINTDAEWSRLEQLLSNMDILLIIKPHPAQDMKYIRNMNSNNIKVITNDELLYKNVELYNILGESDALITDYSSVYIDYLILDKPIGFTIDDMSEYSEHLGFVVENPLDYMPGAKITNIDEMLNFIKDVSADVDLYKDERGRVCKLFNKYTDNKSSDRVLKFLELI